MEKINTYIVPVLNNYDGLVKLVSSLKKYTPQNYKIIVINNGAYLPEYSTFKETVAFSKLKDEITLWIDPYRNLGFGKAMNTGLKLADTEYVTIANDDVEIIYEGWWDEIMERFKEDSRLGGFNPHSPCNKACDGNRYIQYEYKQSYTKHEIEKMKKVFHAERQYVGCCTYFTICRKRMFDEIGFFDESFGMGSGEDYDLCIRAARKKWTIRGGSTTMVWHWWGNTKDNMPLTEGNGVSNFDLIAGGNQNLERKWGPHIDKDPNGWSVAGNGGPERPFDEDITMYKEGLWYQEMPL